MSPRTFLALVLLMPACLDTTPITVTQTTPTMFDAGVDGAASPIELCEACMTSKCASVVMKCDETPHCPAIRACARDLGCFLYTRVKDAIPCATPCAADAGVTSGEDPTVPISLELFSCASMSCSDVCMTP